MKLIADASTADTQSCHQWENPSGKLSGGLLQIGSYREICK